MGYGDWNVQFLGHGIGLEIAENPVIARGFDRPIEEGMVIALEPKKGIRGIGMVGTENTFIVTPHGGRSITGNHPGLNPGWVKRPLREFRRACFGRLGEGHGGNPGGYSQQRHADTCVPGPCHYYRICSLPLQGLRSCPASIGSHTAAGYMKGPAAI